MKDFLIYMIKSGICIGLFLVVYQFCLRKTTFFKFSRYFLLSGLAVSLVAPGIYYSYEVKIPLSTGIMERMNIVQEISHPEGINIWSILFFVYVLGCIAVLFRNLGDYYKISSLIKSAEVTKMKRYKIFDNNRVSSPFTILNYIVLNTTKLSDTETKIILEHEVTHINQKHWIDLLCSECTLILQWFNPLMWVYISLLKENHEFMADRAVIQSGTSPQLYQAVLINQQIRSPVFSLSNSFNHFKHLNRIVMMKKTKSSPWKRISTLSIIPLFGLFFWVSAKPNYVTESPEQYGLTSANEDTSSHKEISIIGYKNTLILLDGVEISQAQMQAIDVNTIESISVLKNEEATKLYGEKAKDGVVLVKQKTKETFSVNGVNVNPLILLDGKEISKSQMDKIDANTIESIFVLKNEESTKLYGEKAKDGVVLIKQKTKETFSVNEVNVNPLILLDGKEISKSLMDAIDANTIESISVLKNEETTKLYGEKAKDGVVSIKLKDVVVPGLNDL